MFISVAMVFFLIMAWSILVREDVMRVGTEGRGLVREGNGELNCVKSGGNTAKEYESKGWLRTVIGKIYQSRIDLCGLPIICRYLQSQAVVRGVDDHPADIRKTTGANWVRASA